MVEIPGCFDPTGCSHPGFPGATSADGDLGRALHAPRASALACPFDQSPPVLTTG